MNHPTHREEEVQVLDPEKDRDLQDLIGREIGEEKGDTEGIRGLGLHHIDTKDDRDHLLGIGGDLGLLQERETAILEMRDVIQGINIIKGDDKLLYIFQSLIKFNTHKSHI